MNMLINSIKEKGIIQPLTVKEHKNGTYEIIAWQEKFKMGRAINKTIEIKSNSDTVEDFLFIKPEKK